MIDTDSAPEEPDLTPILAPDPLDLRVSLASIIHWADSHEVRVRLMHEVAFPVEDLSMFLVVNQLAHQGAMRPTDLAQMLGTGKANLSKIAHRLVDAGLVTRVRSRDDERSVLLALTPDGRDIGRRIMARVQQSLDQVLADWADADVADLRRLLARLAGGQRGGSLPSSSGGCPHLCGPSTSAADDVVDAAPQPACVAYRDQEPVRADGQTGCRGVAG